MHHSAPPLKHFLTTVVGVCSVLLLGGILLLLTMDAVITSTGPSAAECRKVMSPVLFPR